MIRTTLTLLLAFASLHLGAAPQKKPSSAKATSIPKVDVNDKLGLPKSLVGAVISRRTNQFLFGFRGRWTKSPQITGSGPATYSQFATQFVNFMSDDEQTVFRLSINAGMKQGKGVFRVFLWPEEGFTVLPSPQEDEGTLTEKDGVFTLEGDKYLVIFKGKSPDAGWEPNVIKAYRLEGTDFTPERQPLPGKPHGTGMWPTQFVPAWMAASGVDVSDGLVGKRVLKFFGGQTLAVTPYAVVEGKRVMGASLYLVDSKWAKRSNEEALGIFGRGLTFFSGGQSYLGQFVLSALQGTEFELKTTGNGTGNGGQSSVVTISGQRVPVTISEADTKEYLDRAKQNGWVVGAGPWSLEKLLLKAYAGCQMVAPVPALWLSADSTPGIQHDQQTKQIYAERIETWRAAIESVGGSMTVPEATGQMVTTKPAPLGYIKRQ